MVVTVFLCYTHIFHRLQFTIFHTMHLYIRDIMMPSSFDRYKPFNRLWNETKAFLVAVPDWIAFAVSPDLLVLHVRDLLLLLSSSSSSPRTILSSKEKVYDRIRTADPWRRETYTWRISPPDHDAPLIIQCKLICIFVKWLTQIITS